MKKNEFDDIKIRRMGTDKVEYKNEMIESVEKTSSWITFKRASIESDTANFYHIEEDEVPFSTWEKNEYNPEYNPARKNASFTIDETLELEIGVEHTLYYKSSSNIYREDEFDFDIVQNDDGIGCTSDITFSYYKLSSTDKGSFYFRIYDKTANCYTNICYVSFEETTPNPGDSIDPLLVGTWNVTTTGLLYDTIEFYDDGTGKVYHSAYPGSGYNTFNWEITNVGEFKLTNSIGQSDITTYSLNGTTLSLTNFFSYSYTVYAIKN